MENLRTFEEWGFFKNDAPKEKSKWKYTNRDDGPFNFLTSDEEEEIEADEEIEEDELDGKYTSGDFFNLFKSNKNKKI